MEEKKMGKSQKAMLDWVMAQDHPVDATEAGLAVYDTTSSCAKLASTFWSRDQVRRQWAGKLLNLLVRKGHLQRVKHNGVKGYFEPVKIRFEG